VVRALQIGVAVTAVMARHTMSRMAGAAIDSRVGSRFVSLPNLLLRCDRNPAWISNRHKNEIGLDRQFTSLATLGEIAICANI